MFGIVQLGADMRFRGQVAGALHLHQCHQDSTEEAVPMKAIVATDAVAGTAGLALAERPEPQAAINDVVVEIHASGFVSTELAWPSTWTDRRDRDGHRRSPGTSSPGWSPRSATARRGCRSDSGCSVSRTGIATAPWRST